MSELTPLQSANLAEEIYDVQDEILFEIFQTKNKDIFSQEQQKLTANVGGRIIRSAKDAFGLCTMGAGQYAGNAFLIFRGTTTANNKADFVSDARIGLQNSKTGSSVHIGFNEVFKSMLRDIQQFISSNQITGTVHCIGHSLGGAVATLAADWVKTNFSRFTVKLYTFGQPRVGLLPFATKFTSKLHSDNVHRLFHTTDPVPMVPIFPYIHAPAPGNGHLISSESLVTSGEAHKMANYIHSIKQKELGSWPSISRSAPVFNHEKAIEEWVTSKVRPDPEHPRTWEWLDRAFIYVLTKIGNSIFTALHTAIVGVHTLADRIAWILMKGIDLAKNVGFFVKKLIEKIVQILGMPPLAPNHSITQAFLASLLTMLMRRSYDLARRAIRSL